MESSILPEMEKKHTQAREKDKKKIQGLDSLAKVLDSQKHQLERALLHTQKTYQEVTSKLTSSMSQDEELLMTLDLARKP